MAERTVRKVNICFKYERLLDHTDLLNSFLSSNKKKKPLKVTAHSFCHYTGFYPGAEIAAPTVLCVGYFIAKEKEILLSNPKGCISGRVTQKGLLFSSDMLLP